MSIDSGERDLWAAVLWAVTVDLQSSSLNTKRERDEAISWVGKYPSRDFRQVCSLAGCDPDAVHWRLRRIIDRKAKNHVKKPAQTQGFAYEKDIRHMGRVDVGNVTSGVGGCAAR